MDSISREVEKLQRGDFKPKEGEIFVTKIRLQNSNSLSDYNDDFSGSLRFYWASPSEREFIFVGPTPESVIGSISLYLFSKDLYKPDEISCKVFSVKTRLQLISILLYRQSIERMKISQHLGFDFPTEDVPLGEFRFSDGKKKEILLTEETTYQTIIEG